MFNKDFNKNMFKGKPKLNKSLKESPYTCKECNNPLMFKGKTHLTCNCSDCPCFGENQLVNDVGPPANCSSVLRYRLSQNEVTGVYTGIDTINAVGQTAGINIFVVEDSDSSIDIQLFDIAGAVGGITVTGITIAGTGVGTVDAVEPTPTTYANGTSQVLASITLDTVGAGTKTVGVTIETDCGDIYTEFTVEVVNVILGSYRLDSWLAVDGVVEQTFNTNNPNPSPIQIFFNESAPGIPTLDLQLQIQSQFTSGGRGTTVYEIIVTDVTSCVLANNLLPLPILIPDTVTSSLGEISLNAVAGLPQQQFNVLVRTDAGDLNMEYYYTTKP